MGRGRHVIVAAGGTGGHMVPAHVLAEEMKARGWTASLITDERGLRYPGLFEGCAKHVIPAASLGGRNPFVWLTSLRAILAGRTAARRLYAREKPAVVVGFGGYPAFPALLGALANGVPTAIHEQNAVLGRVNRLLAGRVDLIATAYPDMQRLDPGQAGKVALVGNPVRDNIVALRERPYPIPSEMSPLHLLVIGGSQGASILSQVVPAAIERLPDMLRNRIRVRQQCRPEDVEGVRAAYAHLGVAAETSTFIEDMATALSETHLVVARSGASTVAELSCVGRPAIFVPLPTSMDNHQVHNTREMVDAGGGRMILQPQFTAETVSEALQRFLSSPDVLAAAAGGARSVGRPDAGARLADIVERLGKGQALAASGSETQPERVFA